MYSLKIIRRLKGRAVGLAKAGDLLVGRNQRLFRISEDGRCTSVCQTPAPLWRRLIGPSRLLCRAFRHEIRGYHELHDGRRIVATRQGVFWGDADDFNVRPAALPKTDLEIKPPMTITVDSQERVLWGEYWGNHSRRDVRLFVSYDRGEHYEPFWRFSGDIKHIHNILEDPYDDCYWLFTGDDNGEPGFGRLSRDLRHLDWLIRGSQQYRAVGGFIFRDRIVYGTDSDQAQNHICVVDKRSGRTEVLCKTPGSSIYAARFGKWYVVSTSVEYFKGYDNDESTLWISPDALNWQQVYTAVKDIWHKMYFQFGSIVLPRTAGEWDRDYIVFSGQALRGIDNRVLVADVEERD